MENRKKATELTPEELREEFAKGDRKRDAGLTTPADIVRVDDLHYGPDEKWNALDVYYPRGTAGALPVIVSFHGGGYVYGDKEVYQFYCMSLAQRGFAVVNFNYHLAPEHKFPTPLLEANAVFRWICSHAQEYYMDTENVFLVGDSAGAQLASQYALIWADPEYAALFGLTVPGFRLAAVCLNCGMYDLKHDAAARTGAPRAYFDPDPETAYGEQINVLDRIDSRYPPAYVMSAANDFLLGSCAPMAKLLAERGVTVESKIYGTPDDKTAGHVFHCNVRLPLAAQCNDDETAFMRRFLR